ncbi:MAG: TRAP transporter small permease [Kiritimatiellia bacterium]|jgi:TRAP-type C4-dicarboxylate transport system permease small subunit
MSIRQMYHKSLRVAIRALAGVAGLAILAMMLVICADVLLRAGGRPIAGNYDVVRILSVFVIVCALPYTTAVKGHVAVELVFRKLSRRWQIIVDSFNRVLAIGLFGVLAVYNVRYGMQLKEAGELMATLPVPIYWIPYVIAVACGMITLVIFYHMLHPGKALLNS